MLELNKIYNMDCIEGMKMLDDNSVDCVITSPPYNFNLRIHYGEYGGACRSDKNKYADTEADRLSIDEYYGWQVRCIEEMLRVSRGLVFYNIQMITGNKNALLRLFGYFYDKIKEIIIWDKITAEPSVNDGVLNSMFEFVIVFDKNDAIARRFTDAKFSRGTVGNVFRIPKNRVRNAVEHKAVFPIELPNRILDCFTSDGDVILDPFIGTGTTAVSCLQKGRKFIGFELNEKFYNYANAAVKSVQKVSGNKLF
jgi:DNA modification methylase